MTGLSVIVRNKSEFDRIKDFLGEETLYLNWVPQMATILTGVIIHYSIGKIFPTGSVGSAENQEKCGIRLVEFSQYFKF